MGVARGGLHLRMTEQLADHGKAHALTDGVGGEAVAQVVDAHFTETGFFAVVAPRLLWVFDVRPLNRAPEYVGIIQRTVLYAATTFRVAGLMVGIPVHGWLMVVSVETSARIKTGFWVFLHSSPARRIVNTADLLDAAQRRRSVSIQTGDNDSDQFSVPVLHEGTQENRNHVRPSSGLRYRF